MNEPIKPIETHYAGCRFRSRLEARWAVFFDTLGVRWQYEPQGYVVNGRPYLPDFVLPDLNASVEVKGDATQLDLAMLADAVGEHWVYTLVLGPIPQMDTLKVPTHTLLVPAIDVRPDPQTFAVVQAFIEALQTVQDPAARAAIERMAQARHGIVVTIAHAVWITTRDSAAFIALGPSAVRSAAEALEPGTVWPIMPMPKVQAAYEAARSARFEHGESG
jgi:hypothetical protein